MTESDIALEQFIAAGKVYQKTLGDDAHAFNVFSMLQVLRGWRRPETVERLDAERLQRARAA